LTIFQQEVTTLRPTAPTRRKGVCHTGELPATCDVIDGGNAVPPFPDPGGRIQLPGLATGGTACRTRGCTFFGAPETSFFCSKCFRETARALQASRV